MSYLFNSVPSQLIVHSKPIYGEYTFVDNYGNEHSCYYFNGYRHGEYTIKDKYGILSYSTWLNGAMTGPEINYSYKGYVQCKTIFNGERIILGAYYNKGVLRRIRTTDDDYRLPENSSWFEGMTLVVSIPNVTGFTHGTIFVDNDAYKYYVSGHRSYCLTNNTLTLRY